MKLKDKVILIISPQSWGNMFLAKHHYAMELARNGNEVYFLNPPNKEKPKSEIEIVKSSLVDSLYLINHSLGFSSRIKFKWIGLFHFLMKFHIAKVRKAIAKEIDIVWSFDLGAYYPFKYFSKKSFKLYSPVDEPSNSVGVRSAKGADIIISITREILKKYSHINVPKHFIYHGLADEFVNPPKANFTKDNVVRIGLSGNWLRKDIDTECLLNILNQNPDIIFEFWGTYEPNQSNIGGSIDTDVAAFLLQLTTRKNVIMHGAVHPQELALQFQRMDGFLICYDILKDQSKGTNYHKIMEYLSTGKVVISNNITTYSNMPNMIEMTSSRTDNKELPQLFKTIVINLQHYNQPDFVSLRQQFALSNLYSKKIGEIENLLN